MNIIVLTVIGMCLAVAVAIFLFRPYDYGASTQRFRKIGGQQKPDPSEDTAWRSARIRPGLNCCAMVKSLEDQTFLAREVPTLPLTYCSESNCTCHYLFQDDRRSGLDRRAELAKLKGLLPGIDRRRSPGRRVGDLLPA